MLIKIWVEGQVSTRVQGPSVGRGIGFMSKCWKRRAEEHGHAPGPVLAVLSMVELVWVGAACAMTVSGLKPALEVYVNLTVCVLGLREGTLRYGL